MSTKTYEQRGLTNEKFDEILAEIVTENVSGLLDIPGVYEAVSEHFNNEVLERFDAKEAV